MVSFAVTKVKMNPLLDLYADLSDAGGIRTRLSGRDVRALNRGQWRAQEAARELKLGQLRERCVRAWQGELESWRHGSAVGSRAAEARAKAVRTGDNADVEAVWRDQLLKELPGAWRLRRGLNPSQKRRETYDTECCRL